MSQLGNLAKDENGHASLRCAAVGFWMQGIAVPRRANALRLRP
jgi:hypothetical protein